jgi:hypothetical protein
MTSVSFAEALSAARRRNEVLAGAYKEAARHLLSRSVSSVAASAADQRGELGEELAKLEAALPKSLSETRLSLEEGLLKGAELPAQGGDEAKALLSRVLEAETADGELFALLAAAARSSHPDSAAELDAFSDQAKKRASWARDHLDLLALS